MNNNKAATVREMLKNWSIAQKAGALLPCPRCGRIHTQSERRTDALSRRYDVDVCAKCGTIEALEDAEYSAEETGTPKLPIDSKEYNDYRLERWWIAKSFLGIVQCERTKFAQYEKAENGSVIVEVDKKVMLSKQDIDDIVCMALEGGITYWCDYARVDGEFLGEYASDQISRGGSLILHDKEDDLEYALDLDNFIGGFVTACKDGYADEWFDDDGGVDCGMIDADGADVIIQYALFGEVVYG